MMMPYWRLYNICNTYSLYTDCKMIMYTFLLSGPHLFSVPTCDKYLIRFIWHQQDLLKGGVSLCTFSLHSKEMPCGYYRDEIKADQVLFPYRGQWQWFFFSTYPEVGAHWHLKGANWNAFSLSFHCSAGAPLDRRKSHTSSHLILCQST